MTTFLRLMITSSLYINLLIYLSFLHISNFATIYQYILLSVNQYHHLLNCCYVFANGRNGYSTPNANAAK